MTEQLEMLSDQAVAEYLAANPDFFMHYASLLEGLQIPHAAGGAASLLERQIQVLRDKSAEQERKLANFIDAARQNEMQVSRQHRLILALLHTDSLAESVEVLHDQLKEDFGVDFVETIFFADATDDSKVSATQGLYHKTTEELKEAGMSVFFENNRSVFGRINGPFKAQLFGSAADDIASIAMVPVTGENPIGMLVLASTDPDRFTPAMGGELLERLGQLIGGIFSLRAAST